MPTIFTPEKPLLADLLKSLPTGAVATWEGVGLLVAGTEKPIYLFVVNDPGGSNTNPLIQFNHPKNSLQIRGEVLMYLTGETVANKKFFNRTFLPTFFVFGNYLHAYAFEQKLANAGYAVRKEKYK